MPIFKPKEKPKIIKPKIKAPRLLPLRSIETVISHFNSLNHFDRIQFIRDVLVKHPKAEDIALEIGKKRYLTSVGNTTYSDIFRDAGLDYKLREYNYLEANKKFKPHEKELHFLNIANWFANGNLNVKLRIIKNKFYGLDPKRFLKFVLEEYRKTNSRIILDLYLGNNKELINFLVEKGHLELLFDAGFREYLTNNFPEEVYKLRNKGLKVLVENDSAIKKLLSMPETKREFENKIKIIANFGSKGLIAIIRAGFFLSIAESYKNQIINAIGKEKYDALRKKYKI